MIEVVAHSVYRSTPTPPSLSTSSPPTSRSKPTSSMSRSSAAPSGSSSSSAHPASTPSSCRSLFWRVPCSLGCSSPPMSGTPSPRLLTSRCARHTTSSTTSSNLNNVASGSRTKPRNGLGVRERGEGREDSTEQKHTRDGCIIVAVAKSRYRELPPLLLSR
jgi:hypothetical protein